MKIKLFLVLIVFNSALGNLLLSRGMRDIGDVSGLPPVRMAAAVLRSLADPWVDGGIVLLAVFFFSYLAILSLADLSYVLPTTAASYLVVAVLSHFLLHETVSPVRWTGIGLIIAGVMLVLRTEARTRTSP